MNIIGKFIKEREKIVLDYCVKKGWSTNPDDLTIEQIMEIRSLQEWKDPLHISQETAEEIQTKREER